MFSNLFIPTETPCKNEELSYPEPNWEDEEHIVMNLTCVAIFGITDTVQDKVHILIWIRFCVIILC